MTSKTMFLRQLFLCFLGEGGEAVGGGSCPVESLSGLRTVGGGELREIVGSAPGG